MGSASNLEVDEDGFLNAANDTLTARTDETDSTELLTATGTAVVNFGSDVPANLLGSIVLVDTPALDGQLHTHDGQSVTFALDGLGDLVGSAGATAVIRIHLVSAVAGPAAGDVTYTYSTTLLQPLEHADGVLENSITLTGVTVQVTDSDADTVTASFNVTIVDDVPTATVDSGNVNEGALLTVAAAGVLSNDVAGADGFTAGGGVVGVRAASGDPTTDVTTGVNTSIAGLHGTLILQADGSYTYQSTANNITADTTDVFVYTVKDGDGDLSTTTLTINLPNVTVLAPDDRRAGERGGRCAIGSDPRASDSDESFETVRQRHVRAALAR